MSEMSPPWFIIDISLDCSKLVHILIPFMFRAVIPKLLDFFILQGLIFWGG